MLTYSTLPKLSEAALNSQKFKQLIVFMHGLGDRGASWISFFISYQRDNPDTLFVFPDAPTQPVTLNGGMRMPSWYDIIHLDPVESIEDRVGFEASSRSVAELVEKLTSIHSPGQLVVGGFSQGGALSLYLTLKGYLKPSALLILSSYLPFAKTDFSSPSMLPTKGQLSSIPVFWGHGTADPLIPLQWAKFSSEKISNLFKSICFKEYPDMTHGVCDNELTDAISFLHKLK